jgi:GntR family transcriptional repressor for pyruvate dehydrogenase complex
MDPGSLKRGVGQDGRQRFAMNATRRNRKTSEVIARDLAYYIINNELEEGAMLPVEKDMLETLGVGRTTLREALRLLESRGVLTIRAGPNGGPVVRRPRPADFSDALTLILQFDGASLADVWEARIGLEPTIAELAASRITEEQLTELERSVTAMLENTEREDIFLEENQLFHDAIAEAAGSKVLMVMMATIHSIADGNVLGVQYSNRRRKLVAEAHENIAGALRRHDGAAAASAMRDHVREAGAYWQRKYPELYGRPVRWLS